MNLLDLRAKIYQTFLSGAVVLLLAALLAPAARVAAAQDDLAFESVKKGKANLDEGEMSWQAVTLPTAEDDEGKQFAPGFLYAAENPIVIARAGSDQTLRVRKGGAFSVSAGARLVPTSVDGDETEFLSLGLLPENDADEPAGDPFDLEEGEYAFELLRAEMPRVQPGGDGPGTVEFGAGDLPALIVVVSGDVEMTDDDDSEDLEGGDVLTITGDVEFTQTSPDEALILAVTIAGDDDGGNRGSSDREDEGAMGASSGSGAASGGATTTTQGGGHMDSPPPSPSPAPVNDHESDLDGDGLTLGREMDLGTHPDNPDTDGDHLLDGEEVDHFATNPLMTDTDGDTLTDGEEVHVYGIDPNLNDTDYDGLGDAEELFGLTSGWVTSPQSSDTDGDGLDDLQETTIAMTNPTAGDTDGDGILDGDEVMNGTDPNVPDTVSTETDGTDGTDDQTNQTDDSVTETEGD